MEFEVNNGETIDINKFMKIYSAENGSHYIPGTADLLRIEWDSNIALQDLSIELNLLLNIVASTILSGLRDIPLYT